LKLEPLENFIKYSDDSSQARYIFNYVKFLKCTKIYIEEKYIDKDYIVDYQKFYSRSFNSITNLTSRIHFFKDDMTEESLTSSSDLSKSYLGFVIIKPVCNSNGQKIIGRTVLCNYNINSKTRTLIETRQHASILGCDLEINTLPFISQDIAVGACATASLWTAICGLSHKFDILRMSLYEITEKANECSIIPSRSFPSDGLTPYQICYFLHNIGLEFDLINMDDIEETSRELYINIFIKSFILGNIPIIAGLKMTNEDRTDYHAVVISGYKESNGVISDIYVHDDQIGPYASITSKDGFKTWNYKDADGWTSAYDTISFVYAIIPLYHKIRLPLTQIWLLISRYAALGAKIKSELVEGSAFKKSIRQSNIKDKTILEIPLPKYVWIISIIQGKNCTDQILDATSPFPINLKSINYRVDEF
jgi:hypothetical protein